MTTLLGSFVSKIKVRGWLTPSSPPSQTFTPLLRIGTPTPSNSHPREGGDPYVLPDKGVVSFNSDRFNVDYLNIESDRLACQRMIEINIHRRIVNGLYHARHLSTCSVAENDQETRL